MPPPEADPHKVVSVFRRLSGSPPSGPLVSFLNGLYPKSHFLSIKSPKPFAWSATPEKIFGKITGAFPE
jgi:hypothetical protein